MIKTLAFIVTIGCLPLGASQSKQKVVKLEIEDKIRTIPLYIARYSITIMDLLHDTDIDEIVPLADISLDQLKKILEWVDFIDDFDGTGPLVVKVFLQKLTASELIELLQITNYLAIHVLFDLIVDLVSSRSLLDVSWDTLTLIPSHIRNYLILLETASQYGPYKDTKCDVFKGHKARVNSIAITKNGKFVISVSDDKTVRVWDIASGKQLAKCTKNERIFSVSSTPDGATAVYSFGRGKVGIWEWATGNIDKERKVHDTFTFFIKVTADGKAIITSSDGHFYIRDLKTGEELEQYDSRLCRGRVIYVTPDDSRVIFLFGKQIWVHSLPEMYREHALFDLKEEGGCVVCMTLDGETGIVGFKDGGIRSYNLSLGIVKTSYMGHSNSVSSLCLTPDAKKLVSGSFDKTVRVWDLDSGTMLAIYYGHKASIYSVAVTPNGKNIISGSRDGTIRLWDMLFSLSRAQAKKLWKFLQENRVEEELLSASGKFFKKIVNVAEKFFDPTKRQRENEEVWKEIWEVLGLDSEEIERYSY